MNLVHMLLCRYIWTNGLVCSGLACLVFSFSGLFVKMTNGRVPVLEVCLLRSILSFVFSIIVLKVRPDHDQEAWCSQNSK